MSEVKVPFVDLKGQYQSIKLEIDLALQQVLEQSQFVGGDRVNSFEQKFADYLGISHCIGCGNGTDALEITLQALGVGPGDEVIVPVNSWISTAEAVTYVGADPVFVDVLPDEYNLNPALLEKALSSKTKCIIAVHFTGLPAGINEIMVFAEKHDLLVVEDCAQAHGAKVGDRKVGTFGVAATFSFYPSKNLGAYGDAGAIVTNNDQLAEKLRRVSNHGQLTRRHDHAFPGRNSHLDSLQAAILQVKLQYLDRWNQQRNNIARWYDQYLHPDISRPVCPEGYASVFHLYIIRVPHRERLRVHLLDQGILTSIHYPNPIPFTAAYGHLNARPQDFPVAHALSKEILSLPMYPELLEEQVQWVAESINEFINQQS